MRRPSRSTSKSSSRLNAADLRPISHHLAELRRRLFWVVGSVLVAATGAYFVQQQLVRLLLRPAHGQQLIYTSPGGGIGFLFTICLYVGLIASLPVMTYHLVRFIEPALSTRRMGLVWRYCLASLGLVAGALGFGYFIGLPPAFNFLGHQFTTPQIYPLFTAQAYLSFVTMYLLGTVLLFQLPLLMIAIQRLRPRPPRSWLRGERYVVAGAFIVAMIMVPTPNLLYQLVIAGPVIVTYNAAVALMWISSRRQRRREALIKADTDRRAEVLLRTRLAQHQRAATLEAADPVTERRLSVPKQPYPQVRPRMIDFGV